MRRQLFVAKERNFVVRRQLDQQKQKAKDVLETAQRSNNCSWTQNFTHAAHTPTVQTQITNIPNVPTKIRPGNVYVGSIHGLPSGTPTSTLLESNPGGPTRTPTRTRTATSMPSRLVRRQQRVDQYQQQRVNQGHGEPTGVPSTNPSALVSIQRELQMNKKYTVIRNTVLIPCTKRKLPASVRVHFSTSTTPPVHETRSIRH